MYAEARLKIQTIADQAQLGYEIMWEGRPNERPNATYLECFVVWGQSARFITLGPPRVERRTGFVQFSVYVPMSAPNPGATNAEKVADKIVPLYTGSVPVGQGGFTFFPSDLKNVGERDGYYTVVLSVPFQYDYVN